MLGILIITVFSAILGTSLGYFVFDLGAVALFSIYCFGGIGVFITLTGLKVRRPRSHSVEMEQFIMNNQV